MWLKHTRRDDDTLSCVLLNDNSHYLPCGRHTSARTISVYTDGPALFSQWLRKGARAHARRYTWMRHCVRARVCNCQCRFIIAEAGPRVSWKEVAFIHIKQFTHRLSPTRSEGCGAQHMCYTFSYHQNQTHTHTHASILIRVVWQGIKMDKTGGVIIIYTAGAQSGF